MKFDKNLYIQIYAAAREVSRKYGLDVHTAEDITQETSIELLAILANKEKMEKVQNWDAYIKGIIIKKFADHYKTFRKKELSVEDFDSMADIVNESMDKAVENQVPNIAPIIDEYIRKYPKSFTRQNKKLWEIFKQQQYSVPEMIQLMGTNRSGFDTAKNRLLKRIIAIYAKIAASNLI